VYRFESRHVASIRDLRHEQLSLLCRFTLLSNSGFSTASTRR
jgi:hypothetical protein